MLARALGVNEDLAEALALAHDLGHAPFGHAGESGLTAAIAHAGGFDHNAHAVRIVARLEQALPEFEGLNLSWEAIEGLAKHNGPVEAAPWALDEVDRAYPLELTSWPGLEAQVAAIADDIAYDAHDIDDGLRAGLFALDDLLAVPLVADLWHQLQTDYPRVTAARLLPVLIRRQIAAMTGDVLAETGARLADPRLRSVDDVRAAGRPLVGFSAPMAAAEVELKHFLRSRMYHHPRVAALAAAARDVVARLFEAYRARPSLMTERWAATLPMDEPAASRHIADFIAGMTDRYALRCHAQVVGPPPPELTGS